MDERFVVQGDVGLVECSTVAGIKSRIPLLVLVAEANHDQVRLFDQGPGADGVDLGGLMVAPETVAFLAQAIAGSVACVMIGHRCGEENVKVMRSGASFNLIAPIGMNLA